MALSWMQETAARTARSETIASVLLAARSTSV